MAGEFKDQGIPGTGHRDIIPAKFCLPPRLKNDSGMNEWSIFICSFACCSSYFVKSFSTVCFTKEKVKDFDI